jgi:hypothetical protein
MIFLEKKELCNNKTFLVFLFVITLNEEMIYEP